MCQDCTIASSRPGRGKHSSNERVRQNAACPSWMRQETCEVQSKLIRAASCTGGGAPACGAPIADSLALGGRWCCAGGEAAGFSWCGMAPCIMGMPIDMACCMLNAWKSMGSPMGAGILMGPYWACPIIAACGAVPIMYCMGTVVGTACVGDRYGGGIVGMGIGGLARCCCGGI